MEAILLMKQDKKAALSFLQEKQKENAIPYPNADRLEARLQLALGKNILSEDY